MLLDPSVIETPWSQSSVSPLGGAVVVHWANMCTFVIPYVQLHSMLDKFILC